jgi:anti-sigma regulatory factor (Ser/Thr protein kinase)
MMMGLRGQRRNLADGPTLRVDLQRNAEAPSAARAAITGFFEERELDRGTLATLTLLVSELVSNAVAHSDAPQSSPILLCVRLLGEDAVSVEVTDQGSGFLPIPRDPNQQGGGYGLYLVEKQATDWGVRREGGTCVWFEMASDRG